MNRSRLVFLSSLWALAALPALAQITGGPCSPATLNGTYMLDLNGRIISPSSAFQGSFQGVGTATFDGKSKVVFAGTSNTPGSAGQAFNFSGTYTLASNCMGSMSMTSGDNGSFSIVVWSSGQQFALTGTDVTTSTTPVYVWAGNGSSVTPPACGTPTLSGTYTYQVVGTSLSGSVQQDAIDESGVLFFDGQGGVTSDTYTFVGSQTPSTQGSATGTYKVSSNCLASATLKDSNGNARSMNFAINGTSGENLKTIESSATFMGLGSTHSAFYFVNGTTTIGNAAQSVNNVASYAVNSTPPGSVFAIFGQNLATKADQPQNVPLLDTVLQTSVTVNNEPAPLFYVSPTQIDAQMPWDIPANTLATVIVTNKGANGTTSNAAAVFVPAGAAPGISFYSPNRAVVINADQSLNSSTAAANVNDEVVMYFTGGGPVNASGKLTSGSPAPSGLSPVTDPNPAITVGGVSATVRYVGLTPGSIGLYQANFIVPQVAKGTYPVVLTIGGTASNSLGGQDPNPVMTIAN